MSETTTIDVTRLVDEQRIGSFNVQLLIWSFIALFSEGYDLSVMGYAAPDLIKQWHIDRATLGPVFSTSLFGILCGAPVFGFLGDRIGRRPAIMISVVAYGLLSLCALGVSNLTEFVVLRFFIGLGLSGVFPNTVALNAEYAPKRMRAMMIFLAAAGLVLGGASPGWISATLVASHGWKVLFLIGGLLPLVVAACLYFTLPESLKYLALHDDRRAEALELLRRVKPGMAVGPDTRLVVPGEERAHDFSPVKLFAGTLARLTPLIWVAYICTFMTNYFLYSWMPTLYVDSGIDPAHAAIITSMYNVGSAIGGFTLCVMIDRLGVIAYAATFVLTVPFVAALSISGVSDLALGAIVTLVGLSVGSLQSGNVAMSGIIYPTGVRSKGVAWASAVGRVGSVAGPMIGGVLVGWKLPLHQLFLAPIIPLSIGACAAFTLYRCASARLRPDTEPASN